MLEHKGIEYKRVDLIAALHRPLLRARGFEAPTVSALKADGRRVQGTCNISRVLDEIHPEPPLFPADAVRPVALLRFVRCGSVSDVRRRVRFHAKAGASGADSVNVETVRRQIEAWNRRDLTTWLAPRGSR
jgi:glutathione S-transferase